MQERGADGVLVHVEVLAEDEGHLDGVVDIGLARAAALVAVVVGRKVIGAVDLCPLIIVEVGTRGLLKHAEVGSVGNRGLLCRRRRRSRGGHGADSGSLLLPQASQPVRPGPSRPSCRRRPWFPPPIHPRARQSRARWACLSQRAILPQYMRVPIHQTRRTPRAREYPRDSGQNPQGPHDLGLSPW